MIRFRIRPPGKVSNRLKAAGWWYDTVAAVRHLPDDPETWPATERLLDELDAAYGIERLVEPLDGSPLGVNGGVNQGVNRIPVRGNRASHRITVGQS